MQSDHDTVNLFDDLARQLGIAARYTILKRIGAGGMGEVFKARDNNMERLVAIKILSAQLGDSQEATQRFLREAKVLALLKHPNIVNLYSFGVGEKCPYQIIDFLEGHSLSTRLKDGPLDLSEFRLIFAQIIDALRYASARGLVHRDIKPANIFLTLTDGQIHPFLLDFGIVRQLDVVGETLTSTQAVIGSPPYMSPEQCRGEPVDFRSDMYSLGCVMYEAISGKQPFEGENVLEIMLKHMNDPVPKLQSFLDGKEFRSQLSNLVEQCLNKEAALRPASFEELSRCLCDCVDNSSTGTLFVRPRTKAVPWNLLFMILFMASVLPVGAISFFLHRAPKVVPLGLPSTHIKKQSAAEKIHDLERWKHRFSTTLEVDERERLAEKMVFLKKDLGKYFRDRGLYREAIEAYSAILEYTPYVPEVHRERTDVYENLAEVTMAMANSEKNPEKRQSLIDKALGYSAQAVDESASSTSKPRFNARCSRGSIFLQIHKISEAVKVLELAIDVIPGFYDKPVSVKDKLEDVSLDIYKRTQPYLKEISPHECLLLFDLHLKMAHYVDVVEELANAGPLINQTNQWFDRGYADPVFARSDPLHGSRLTARDLLMQEYKKALSQPSAKKGND